MSKKKAKSSKSGLEIPLIYRYTGKLLQIFSEKKTVQYATRLFLTPIKFKTPNRELAMFQDSIHSKLLVPAINKTIHIYEYGVGDKQILLVHGWSGRGTQMVTLADFLISKGYKVISFDAPAHGKSVGNQTNMVEMVACIQEINKKFSNFTGIIGHSMGAMASINAIRLGVSTNFLISLGSNDIIRDIIDDFIRKLGVKFEIGDRIEKKLNQDLGHSINEYSASVAVQKLTIPILLVHDKDDQDVPVEATMNIHKNAKNSQLLLTKGYGHRRIMACDEVLKAINEFIETYEK